MKHSGHGIRSGGFTLIELMIVVIIIAALAGMVLPKVLPRAEEAKREIAKAEIAGIATALKFYYLDNSVFPTTEEGLGALMTKPSSAKKWAGPYLEKSAKDSWGNDYQYKCPGTHNTTGFDIWSQGPNAADAADDVVNWE